MADTVLSRAEKLKVFISYARADGAALAEELVTGLGLIGFGPFLDRHDIAAGEDWEARLGGLIQSADIVVFIISPAAVKSKRCAWEVEHAAKLSKRLIPIQLISIQGQPVPASDVPERLRRLNYIFFRDGQSTLKPLTNSSIAPLAQLATALRQDVEWTREHTRLGEIAARWEARRSSVVERRTTCCCAAPTCATPGHGWRVEERTRRKSPRFSARILRQANPMRRGGCGRAEAARGRPPLPAAYVRCARHVRDTGRVGDGSGLMVSVHQLAETNDRPLTVRRRAGRQRKSMIAPMSTGC